MIKKKRQNCYANSLEINGCISQKKQRNLFASITAGEDKPFDFLCALFGTDGTISCMALYFLYNSTFTSSLYNISELSKKARLKEELSSGGENTHIIEEILGEASSYSSSWLVGRIGHIKKRKETLESSASMSKKNISDETIEQIKAVIREEMRNKVREETRNELKSEVREEMKKTMEAQVDTIIQRLAQMNPTLNLNLDGIVASPNTNNSFPSEVC
ncbi:uncharacterized protein [Euphorbia lathyris]|uniref:uncharacterized protein isoform X2 n=1 Tax=Euphorbia lathyris TaxID=212925 RepID=UPI0033134DE0